MSNNNNFNKIPFYDVLAITKDMCEFVNNKSYEIVYYPIKLKNGDIIKEYMTITACQECDKNDLEQEIIKQNYINQSKFKLPENYCHIATFESNKKRDYISFDSNDEDSIKACFSNEYKYIENFFKNFINFRNNLIANKQVVKDDDIYQYFSSIVGFTEKEREFTRAIIKKNKL